MSAYPQLRESGPRYANSIFGIVEIPGPFADDFTDLKWQFKDHRDGETASFCVGGLRAFVQDCDGDGTVWELRDLRTKTVLAKGEHWDYEPINHFWKGLIDAERALRAEVANRKARLRDALQPQGDK